MLTGADLLGAPRGRRLLLEFALLSERAALGEGVGHPLAEAVSDASFRIAKRRGHAVIRFEWGGRRRPEFTERDVARRLAGVALGPATPDDLLRALCATVDAAMYWQEPDGGDLLCAWPEVTAALGRVADHLAALSAVQAWAARFDPRDQWRLVWDQADPAERPDLDGWRAEVQEDELTSRRERPANPCAALSGTWWSTPPHGIGHSTSSLPSVGPAGLWLTEDSHGWSAATARRLWVDPAANVYEIDGTEAWAALCLEYPLEVTAIRRHDWYRTTGHVGEWVIPDWSRVAQRYDGVHLSIAGYLIAATKAIEFAGSASVIAGWNPDSTWWLRDVARPCGETVRWFSSMDVGELVWTPTALPG